MSETKAEAKVGPTKGAIVVGKPYEWYGCSFIPVGLTHSQANGSVTKQIAAIGVGRKHRGPTEEEAANANLIAESFTVFHETGLSPRELAERVRVLEGALRDLLEHHIQLVNSGDCGFWDVEKEIGVIAARAALATATPLVECSKCGASVPFGSCCAKCGEPSDH